MAKLPGIASVAVVCVAGALLCAVQNAYAQSQTFFWEPEDPPYAGYPQIGTGVAVCGPAAAVGAPQYDFFADPDAAAPLWEGLVNVYVTDAERTRWTLLTVLHADDASPANREFGKAIAMQGRRLVIATNQTLRVYERRGHGYALTDTVVLDDATIPESTPMRLVKDVLAVSVVNFSGRDSVRLFRVDSAGHATPVASLRAPGEPNPYRIGGVSLDADARTLAVGLISLRNARGLVFFYQPRGGSWTRTEIVSAPSLAAAGFGGSVALSGDRLVVGAPGENLELQENSFLWSGAAYVYRRANDRWLRVQRLATNDPSQPSYGLVGFGAEIETNGNYFWITAPSDHDQNASTVQTGPASLYRWNSGHLEYVVDGPNSMPQGGIDMKGRYVIEGDIFGSIHQLEGAHIVDLATLVPAASETSGD